MNNTFQTTLIRPRALRVVGGIISLYAAASFCATAATEEASLSLKGMAFGHAQSLKADSGNWQIAPSKLYSYKITGTIRGKGGALGAVYSKEMPLDIFLDSLKAGTSSLLEGSLDNPTGALPATLVSKSIKGSRNIKGVGRVKLKLKFVGKIASNGQLALEVKGVKATVNGAPLDGVMVFGKGSKLTVSTAPRVQFLAKGQTPFLESAGNASVIITRFGNTTLPASVTVSSSDGTAVAGQDYEAISTTVEFAAGEKQKTVLVPIIDNTIKDKNRKFTLTLSNPGTGTVLGTNLVNTVTIADND